MQALRAMSKGKGIGLRSRPWRFTGLVALALTSTVACTAPQGEVVEDQPRDLSGANEAGYNLAGANLAGANLAGANLAGANLGGANLAGANLAGANLGGTNLGGNNLGGSNLAGANLAGANLAGANLAGANLAGANLAGSNLGGSNLAGANLAGNNVAGTNLGADNLAGANTGFNVHNLTGPVGGMLYSGEDLWMPKTAQCVVMGLGSTAFPKLLAQQSPNAKISVALGKLPWGFSSTANGPMALGAWEATVWGDNTYCVFVLAVPPGVSWAGVAGFIKAVFRWNAPPTQTMEVSGIEASRTYDATVSTTIATYSGMMNSAALQRAGTISDRNFVAGELGFITATTNNQSVMVDFASWVLGSGTKGIILGNVEAVNPPTYVESVYYTVENPDGTVAVKIYFGGFQVPGITVSNIALDGAFKNYQAGNAPKPIPRRCAGALLLNFNYGEPVPAGKCDDGLSWQAEGASYAGKRWDTEPGTTAPMNQYMEMPEGGSAYFLRGPTPDTMLKVLSDTYVHLWDRSYDLAPCTPESDASFCSRRGWSCGSIGALDNCGVARSVNCGTCTAPQTCGGAGTFGVCGVPAPTCPATVSKNSYDGPNYWGTITFTNQGPASSSNYRVEFDVPAGAHCTNDAVPTGAVLSPLTGSGSSAYTTSNHCVFTWKNTTALAANASKTFNYSTDTSSTFDAKASTKVRDTVCNP
jgi:hypothetical protein